MLIHYITPACLHSRIYSKLYRVESWCYRRIFARLSPDNLHRYIDLLGPWSCFALADTALKYYFPKAKMLGGFVDPDGITGLLCSIGCRDFYDVILKYNREVGYAVSELQNNKGVNQF